MEGHAAPGRIRPYSEYTLAQLLSAGSGAASSPSLSRSMDAWDASFSTSPSPVSPRTSTQWIDNLTERVFGHSANMKEAITKLFEQLGVDAPGLLALEGIGSEELAAMVTAEVDKLGCAPFIKAIIKSKLKQLFAAANDMHKSMITPAVMQRQAARSQSAWSNLVVKLSAWATESATSPEAAAHFTREALSATKPALDSDGVTLRFMCPECGTSLRVADSHSIHNITVHLRQRHQDKFTARESSAEPQGKIRKRKAADSGRVESGACTLTVLLS